MYSHPIKSLTFFMFLEEFHGMFAHPLQQAETVKWFLSLKHGKNSVSRHSLEYRITAARTGWDKARLRGTFLHSLSDYTRDLLATRDKPQNLNNLITLATCINNHFHERRREVDYNFQSPDTCGFRPMPNCHTAAYHTNESEPECMQVGRTHFTLEEKQRRIVRRACIYCGQ